MQSRRRLSPDARKDEIVSAAVALFAENGFDGSTRDVARGAGITQPLLYRYFPNKESLIEAVYARVFLESWNSEWDAMLADRSLPVRDRFQRFYEAYTETVFDPVWLRLWNFAALRDAQIYQWYNHVVEEQILKPLVRERRVELGRDQRFQVSRADLEVPWLLHGGLLHHGLRRHVLGIDADMGREHMIAQALNMYFLMTEAQAG
ncbi:TetR/AcrR family transcriptional regulator [Thalassovita gelatinovora]|uniref:TetR/AcrR family transcriptional regulator n=1 Tax=Thalassovita gelatinovora TaxID=53501 RepID=UPI00071E66EA|nr:TetR/AcrR family transcriptional regulator [Thalassovita gelatinovora]QIZ81607.1 TetR/AcrR family transcriptional regulator [Thalassovita gelatinovora]